MPSIRRKAEFSKLMDSGLFVHVNHWLALNYQKNTEKTLRWGWAIPKSVGTAVVRNRLRRWGRECVREFLGRGLDVKFIFKRKKTKDFYKNLHRRDLDQAFRLGFKKMASPR